MASALLNMMMDDEKKATQPTTGAPATPPPAPQMPPPPTVPAPQQTSGASSEPGLGDLLDMLAQGRGPVKPQPAGAKRVLAKRNVPPSSMPAYDWRSDAGSQKPAFTEYEGTTSVDPVSGYASFTPTLDANGNKIVKKAGRDLDFEAASEAARAAGTELPETQTRIQDIRPTAQGAGPSPRTSAEDLMQASRFDAGIEQAFQAGALTQEQRDAQLGSMQRASFGQGVTTESGKDPDDIRWHERVARENFIGEHQVDIDPLSQPPAQVRTTLRADTLIRETVKKGGIANNPFGVVQQVQSQLQGEARKNLTRAENLEKGLISEVGSIWNQNTTINENHPFTQIARTSYGKTLDEVMIEYKKSTGQDLFTPKQLETLQSEMSTKASQYRAEAESITQSAGYHILSNAITVGNQQQFNNTARTRIAKGAIAYLASIPLNNEADVDDARKYFNISLYGDQAMKMHQEGIEKWYAEDPVLGVIFKTGAEGQMARKNAGLDAVRGSTATVVKNALDSVGENFAMGANAKRPDGTVMQRGARSAGLRLMNNFTTPFYDAFNNNDPVEAFHSLRKTPFGRYFANTLAYNLQVVDTDATIKQIFQSEDNEAKQVVMDAITAPFGIKRAINNLFTFDIAEKEDQFENDVPKVQDAMKSGDMALAKQIMAPYASTDQLDILFGDQHHVEGQGKSRDLKLIDLEQMTGVGGSRRQRVNAFLARKQSFAAADEKISASNLNMDPDQLLARLAGNFKVDASILGGFTGEAKRVYNVGYLHDTDEETATREGLADIITYLSPLKDGSMAIGNDPIFTKTLNAVDNAINKLKYQLNNGLLTGYQMEPAKWFLKELQDTRAEAMSNLDDFVSVGSGRKHLFAMTADGPDYSKPIVASGSASRVAQVTDMLSAWITGDNKVDLNRYFSSSGEVTSRKSGTVLVTPVDREGNAIPSEITVSVKPDADGFVSYPVYEKQGNQWVRAKDIFGRPMSSSAPLNKSQQATASLFGKAVTDTAGSNAINADYKRQQVNDLRSHLQNIVEPSGPDAAERRKYLIEEIGIYVDKNNRIENAEVLQFLQKATPNQGRKLLGYLETYGQAESLKPDTNVNWAMNATSTRGRSFGTAEKAISGIEKEAAGNAMEHHRSTVFALTRLAKGTVRNIADTLMDGQGISDPQTRISAAEQTMKSLIKSVPMLAANNMQTAQVRDYMRDYIDAYLADDQDQIKVVNKKITDFVENFQVSQEAADVAQQELVRGAKLNIQRPQTQSDTRSVQEILAQASSANEAERARNRARQNYFTTQFFPELGWIYAEGSNVNIKLLEDMAHRARSAKSLAGNNPMKEFQDDELKIRPAGYRDIEIAKKGKPDYKKVSGGTKINRRPTIVEAATKTKSTKAPNIADTPAVLIKNKPKGNVIGKLGVVGGIGAALGAVGGRGGR